MIVDRGQRNWMVRTGSVAAAAAIAYIFYALRTPNGPRGGTPAGLVFAFAGTALIVFECLLTLRKRYPASPFGRVQTWLKAHVWLGLLSFLLILFHAGFHWGLGLAALLMWLFTIIVVSGMFGVALQNYLPRRMTELVKTETIYEQIPEVIRLMRLEADERIEFLTADIGIEEPEEEIVRAGGKKFYFDPAQRKSAAEKVEAERQRRKTAPQIPIGEEATNAIRSHYLQEIRPFLEQQPSRFAMRLFRSEAALAAYFSYLRTLMPVAAHDVLKDVESICEERRQLSVQQRLHHWLHGWLYVHVPLSFGFLVLTFIHAVISLRY